MRFPGHARQGLCHRAVRGDLDCTTPGLSRRTVTTPGLILGIGAFALLVIGGTLGSARAYVYGVRVIKRDVPIADALIPGRLEDNRTRTGASGARTDWTGWSVRN
jgi:hypothetical protein